MADSPRVRVSSTSPSGRKLSPEELEAVTQRLFYKQAEKARQLEQKRQDTLAKVRPPPKVISPEDLSNLSQRIYTAPIEKKKRFVEEIQKKRAEATASQKTVTETELQEMVQRMFYQEQQKIETSRTMLKTKYRPELESKKLEKEQQAALGDRLSKGVHEKRSANRKALFEKYIAPMDPPHRKLAKADQEAMAQRLCPKAGAK